MDTVFKQGLFQDAYAMLLMLVQDGALFIPRDLVLGAAGEHASAGSADIVVACLFGRARGSALLRCNGAIGRNAPAWSPSATTSRQLAGRLSSGGSAGVDVEVT